MAEYSKKTVAELQEILKSRNLPSSGKKADLIARLAESDKAADTTEAVEPTTTTETAAVEPVETIELQTQIDTQPSAEGQDVTTEGEDKSAPEVEAKVFAMNLGASDVTSEMEKRKARAARFNTGGQADADAEKTETATADGDAQKALERAQRFGGGGNAIGKLDEALSSERIRGPRGQKRESSAMEDPGLKKNFGRRGRFDKRRRGGPGKPTGVDKPRGATFSSDKDRAAAEARKNRFA